MFFYHKTYKLHHLNIESEQIQLSENSWIERSSSFSGRPDIPIPFLADAERDQEPNFGILKFSNPLKVSEVQIHITKSNIDLEKNPFKLHEGAHAAIALSVLTESWFACGLGESWNERMGKKSPSLEFYLFQGGGKAPGLIKRAEQDNLRSVYDYVFRSLVMDGWESESAKLIFFYTKCVKEPRYARDSVLNIGLDHMFTKWHERTMNFHLFCESLFTKESGDWTGGVKIWNEIFPEDFRIDEEFVKAIIAHRHVLLHANATKAQKIVKAWEGKVGFENAPDVGVEFIVASAKKCMRAIVFCKDEYKDFVSNKPI